MIKRLFILLMIGCCLSCHKSQQQQTACGAEICTDLFAIIGIHFTDKNGTAIAVQNYTVVNQRTHLKLVNSNPPANPYGGVGYYVVADDNARSQLSTESDDVLVSATNPTTSQTKTVMFKITGGCNCHVGKISGIETVAFD